MLYKCDDDDEDEDEDNGQAEPVTHRLQFFCHFIAFLQLSYCVYG